jgi:hypothetical protein
MDEIRDEIKNIEKSAERIKSLAGDNHAISKNASIILTFAYLLRFDTPEAGE